MADEKRASGSCLCGGVRYAVNGPIQGVTACHCSQCAKTTGHYFAAVTCAMEDFSLEAQEPLRWYRSSPEAERGFCSRCGSTLFWRKVEGGKTMAMTAGTLDRPTGLRMKYHIFCDSRSDYYDITDGLTQYREMSGLGE